MNKTLDKNERNMINITHIHIELPSEVNKKVDITTDETPEQYKQALTNDLLKYGIQATVNLIYRDDNQLV